MLSRTSTILCAKRQHMQRARVCHCCCKRLMLHQKLLLDPGYSQRFCFRRCNLAPETSCEPVRCRMFCEFGWARNETTGCEVCACAEAPEPTCEPVRCRMRCPFGWARNETTGCEMCACAEPPPPPADSSCPPITCALACEHGFVTDPATGE